MREDIIRDRLRKLEALKHAGVDPYPARVKRTSTTLEARKDFNKLAKARKKIALAGRITGYRDQGRIIFANLSDESGTIQAVLKSENLKNFKLLQNTLDRGDFLCAEGTLFKTKRGEMSLEAKSVAILAKSIQPLPTDFYGLEDTEARLRERYVDLALHPETREMFRKKAIFWDSVRTFMKREGFLEVETGVLELLPGGAEAEPFVTHHNALDTDFYLRISLELPLKKLLVGGFEKVFEIGRIFRNEGLDREHLQDYTQIEFYWAYHDYNDVMRFLERMYKDVVKKTTGGLTTVFQGIKINWGKQWPTVDYVKAFREANGINPVTATAQELSKKARELGLEHERNAGRGRFIDLIYKKTVRPKLTQPCFLINPPVSIEPLAKRSEKNPEVVERVQIVACGTELGKAFSELNDPLDQRARFEEQMKLREAGDAEAQRLDEDFLNALSYGMPPAAGFGMSERLFTVLMDKPIRETVLFPLVRPK